MSLNVGVIGAGAMGTAIFGFFRNTCTIKSRRF